MGKKRDREGSPAKKKQKKSKKHKRKHERASDAEEIDVVNNDLNEGKGLKLKIKFGGRTLSTTELVSDSTMDEDVNIESEEGEEYLEFKSSSQEKASSSKKKIKEDEEKWLEALDKGELDDHGEIKKEKDIGMMTVRQRALHGEVSKDHMETLQQLPMYPERTEEENEEIERKRQLRAKKRKQQMQRQIEETKAQTVEKLLTKGQKNKKETAKSQRKLGDHVRYTSNQDGIILLFSDGVEFPFESQQPKSAPSPTLCAVDGCTKIKRYSCSTTKLPVCSLSCYKQVNQLRRRAGIEVT